MQKNRPWCCWEGGLGFRVTSGRALQRSVPPLQTIRRKKKVQIPVTRPEPEPMSENDEDSYEEDVREARGSRAAPGNRRSDKSWARDRSASRDRSLSPRSDRRSLSSSQPPKPTKVTLVKSRKNEGEDHVGLGGGRGGHEGRCPSLGFRSWSSLCVFPEPPCACPSICVQSLRVLCSVSLH